MGHCQAALLSDRGILRVAGADAHKFLQGVITNDLNKARDGAAVHAGLLSPQGKILFDFFVISDGEDFLIEVAKDNIAGLAKRLGLYRLRAQVEIADAPEFQIAAVWGGQASAPGGAIAFADPRHPDLGLRILLPEDAALGDLACTEGSAEDYHAQRIALSVPEGGRDYAFGDTFPHEALFDQLDGVDFKKGCFIGQEVVSRMEHRGTARKRVVPVEADAPLQPGLEVTAGDLPIGTIGSVDQTQGSGTQRSGTLGLALLRLDRAEGAAAQGLPLKAGDAVLKLRQPSFTTFDVPSMPAA